jgi:asparagine synthase (glutamine-hydrolysing)
MSTADGRYHIVFNGEIYNYVELRRELEAAGTQFRSHSDTEVLLAAFIKWGPQCLKRLVGMFAFAVFDYSARELFLARDFFGIKPFYYTEWQRGLAFASEIKGLLTLPGVSRSAHPQRLYSYLKAGKSDGGESTLFQCIRQLPPGHFIKLAIGETSWPQPQQYWSPQLREDLDLSFDEAALKLKELFLQSVSLHLRSDVPVGACLSGGIDSSAIVQSMRQIGGAGLDLHTFTYADPDPILGEEKWADLVNQNTGAHAHKIRLAPEHLAEDFEALIASQDEPFLSTSIYAQYCVFRAARQAGIIVMLDGQGADEMLAGYRHFIGVRAASLVRNGRCIQAARLLRAARRLPDVTTRRLARSLTGALLPAALHRRAHHFLDGEEEAKWLNSDWFRSRNVVGLPPPTNGAGPQLLKKALHESLVESSLPALLRFEDRNSMASSIESRVPFLTPAIVEFVFSLPENYIVGADGTSKSVFRAAMRGIVPDPILNRRDKLGFVTQEKQWLLQLRPWVQQVLCSDAAQRIPVFRTGKLAQAFAQPKSNGSASESRLWRWLNLIEWSRQNSVTYD